MEGLVAMVGGVEELVARANRYCSAMQANYHATKFRSFAHIDSPARLIKELVKPVPLLGAQ